MTRTSIRLMQLSGSGTKKVGKTITAISALAALALGASAAHGTVLVDFTLSEQSVGTLNTGPFTDTSILDSNISDPTAQGLGDFGEGGSGTAAGEINWNRWGNNVLSVQLTVAAGQTVSLSDITMVISRNGAGAPGTTVEPVFAVVLSGVGTEAGLLAASQLDTAEGIAISGGAGGSFGKDPTTWDLSGASAQTGTFTIGIGYAGTSVGNLRISDIVVNGTVSAAAT